MKTDFLPFKVGTTFNPIAGGSYEGKLKFGKVKISYPSRLDLMAIDPSKIAANENLVYTPGEVVLKVKICKKVTITASHSDSSVRISARSKRHSLIMHSALLMKKALNLKEGFYIDVNNKDEIRHAGLGSSSSLIASVACAINELYGCPVSPFNLVPYLAQNHGEEIDNKGELINPVQCIGGSAAGGQYNGGLIIIAGKSRVIKTMDVDRKYRVVIGIPKDFIALDSKALLKKELAVMDKFIKCGQKFGPTIAYRILHEVLPGMTEGDLKPVGNLLFDYRYGMGSIENCSYTYPGLVELANRLAYLKEEGIVDILSLSSVGPAMVAVSKDIEKPINAFKKQNLDVYPVDIENDKYSVLERKVLDA